MLDQVPGWLPQVMGYAKMIDDGSLARVWQGDESFISPDDNKPVEPPDFSDLNAAAMIAEMRAFQLDQMLLHPLEAFLSALQHLDTAIEGKGFKAWFSLSVAPPTVEKILKSSEWANVAIAATALVCAANKSEVGLLS